MNLRSYIPGIVVCLHSVSDQSSRFHPNQSLSVTPSELDEHLTRSLDLGYEFLSLDSLYDRILHRRSLYGVQVITFDDGYLDNLLYALPILERYAIPFAIYVTSGFISKQTYPWWYSLEHYLLSLPAAIQDSINITNVFHKTRASFLNSPKTNSGFLSYLQDPCHFFSYDPFLTPDQLPELSLHPLVTIGNHSNTHPSFTKLTLEQASAELDICSSYLSTLGISANHFAFPYGSRLECRSREFAIAFQKGFKTITTTYPHTLSSRSSPHSIPRVPFHYATSTIKRLQSSILSRLQTFP